MNAGKTSIVSESTFTIMRVCCPACENVQTLLGQPGLRKCELRHGKPSTTLLANEPLQVSSVAVELDSSQGTEFLT